MNAKRIAQFSALLFAALASLAAATTAIVGQPAPDFKLVDLDGTPRQLADYRGRHVVLEWNNPGCPFVQKHYDSGNMQRLQAKNDARDFVWLSINSTHPGHQDYLPNEKMRAWLTAKNAVPDAYLPDNDGSVGRLYGAKTTPHMFVINPAGVLVYAGAIDDRRGTDPAEIATAKNFVAAALAESQAGRAVSVATSAPYGCSVKYR
jgi:hypothetical protein